MTNAPSNKTILIVEDDPDIRESFRDALEMEGFKVELANNGQHALERLRQIPPPSLIFLDLMMPVMNGLQFLEERAKDPALSQIPVYVVSAVRDQAQVPAGVSFVRKPLDLEEILLILDQ